MENIRMRLLKAQLELRFEEKRGKQILDNMLSAKDNIPVIEVAKMRSEITECHLRQEELRNGINTILDRHLDGVELLFDEDQDKSNDSWEDFQEGVALSHGLG